MRPAHYRTRDILTPRQREVLALVARGYTNPQIASELGISLDGAKFQVSEILARLDVSSREEAAAWWNAEHSPVARVRDVARRLAIVPLRYVLAGAAVCGGAVLVVAAVILTKPSASPGATATAVATTELVDSLASIQGRVRSIDVAQVQQLAAGPSRRDLGSITDAGVLRGLVGELVAAPEATQTADTGPAPYEVAINLENGTAVDADYFPRTGEMIIAGGVHVITLPIDFLQTLSDELNGLLIKDLDAARATPTPTTLPLAAACPTTQQICDFAASLSPGLRTNPSKTILRDLAPVTVACPPAEDRSPGLDLACDSLPAGEVVTGLTYDAIAKAWALFPTAQFTTFVSSLFADPLYQSWSVAAVGCPGESPASLDDCSATFALSIVAADEPGAAMVLFYDASDAGTPPSLTGIANWLADSPATRGADEAFGIYDADGLHLQSYWFQPWTLAGRPAPSRQE
jgi:DNA-binding CsgD family transcriptional regulator